MRVSTDDSVSPSSTRGSREIDPNRRETLEREKERGEGRRVEEKKNNGVGRENGNEESGTKCETWEEKKGMEWIAMKIIIRLCLNGTVPTPWLNWQIDRRSPFKITLRIASVSCSKFSTSLDHGVIESERDLSYRNMLMVRR